MQQIKLTNGRNFRLWHRVVPFAAKGMAPGQAFYSQPRPHQDAVFVDGLFGVVGAGRVEAAGRW